MVTVGLALKVGETLCVLEMVKVGLMVPVGVTVGGGAGAAATSSTGGAGKSYDISGTSQFYAGGGAGSAYSGASGSGGSGVGGNGPGGSAVVNTGSGGAGFWSSAGRSGSGSSGICIFKYLDTYPAATVTGSPTITVAGGFRTYKFTGSGTIIFN
jgi:hypothetical protein